ncbi:MAG: FkbM family methyltransferase [Thermodesulfovibrionales bacterium]
MPVLELPEEWDRFFPGERVDMLKIDIEGAEIDFLQSHSSFLKRVDSIVIEWHAWITSLPEVRAILERNGFLLKDTYNEDQHAGTALFRKMQKTNPP